MLCGILKSPFPKNPQSLAFFLHVGPRTELSVVGGAASPGETTSTALTFCAATSGEVTSAPALAAAYAAKTASYFS